MGIHQIKRLLHGEGNRQQNKTVIYWMGDYVSNWFLWQGVNIQNLRRTYTAQHQKKKNV